MGERGSGLPDKVRRPAPGFTLVELLVVIAITAVLIGLLLAAVQQVRGAAARTQCSNQMHQFGLALHHYHDAHQSLPPGISYRNGADPYPFMSWNTRLLPYLEQDNLWGQAQQAFAQDPRFLNNPPHTGFATVVPVYACPADGRTATAGGAGKVKVAYTSYLGVEGTDQYRKDGVLYLDSRTRLTEVTDGTSHTLAVGERPPSADGVMGWWYAGEGQSKDGSGDMVLGVQEKNVFAPTCPAGPYSFGPGRFNNQCDAFHFWSPHTGGGAHFLFCDGSVRFLRYEAAPLMPALASRAGGESVSLPD